MPHGQYLGTWAVDRVIGIRCFWVMALDEGRFPCFCARDWKKEQPVTDGATIVADKKNPRLRSDH